MFLMFNMMNFVKYENFKLFYAEKLKLELLKVSKIGLFDFTNFVFYKKREIERFSGSISRTSPFLFYSWNRQTHVQRTPNPNKWTPFDVSIS